ncbi:MAG: S8 family serine peptidase [Bdellovibrionales bacterium]
MKTMLGQIATRSLGLAGLVLTVALSVPGQAVQTGRYLVGLKQASSTMMAPQRAKLQAEKQKLMQYLQSSQFQGQLQSQLSSLDAVVVKVTNPQELESLRQHAAVEFVDHEVFFFPPRPVLGQAKMANFAPQSRRQFRGEKTPWGINAVRAPEAWQMSGGGAGARVLVLDTGIDKDHGSLAANFEAGQNFLEADGRCGENLPYPFFDGEGHGTHVAGTIAGGLDQSGFTGVAPRAKVSMGRVCGLVRNPFTNECQSGCSNIAVAEGINWGVRQKVDVVSMSLGGPSASPSERRAVQAALQAGVTLVAASGNGTPDRNGNIVYDRVSYPAALPGVIAVGAIDVSKQKASFSQYGPELSIVAPGVDVVSTVPRGTGMDPEVRISLGQQQFVMVKSSTFQGSASPSTPVINELVPAGLGKPGEFPESVRGRFALVQRGEIMFAEKAANAIRAGAKGLVVYNNAPGLIRGSITADGSTLPVPVFMVEQQVGEAILKAVQSGRSVRASLVVVQTDYASFDGTSMATPHVAGVIALMKAVNKGLTPAQVKEILMGTAVPLQPNNNNQLGAGLVDAARAVEASSQSRRLR